MCMSSIILFQPSKYAIETHLRVTDLVSYSVFMLLCIMFFTYTLQDTGGWVDGKSENRLYVGNLDLRINE